MIEVVTTNAKPMNKAQQIREYVAANPTVAAKDVAKNLGVALQYVYTVMYKVKAKTKVKKGKKLGRPRKVTEASENLKKLVDEYKNKRLMQSADGKRDAHPFLDAPLKADPVNHPAHYKVGGIETIDFIEAKKLGYNLGNVVKYITRSDHKGNRLQDLRKAQWYLEREIWNAEDNKKTT